MIGILLNQEERDKLRAKHQPMRTEPLGRIYCRHCMERDEPLHDFKMTPWPCDAMMALNYLEAISRFAKKEEIRSKKKIATIKTMLGKGIEP